jgi:protein-S-isoprenylcysteine O-methyltransferase Ste14
MTRVADRQPSLSMPAEAARPSRRKADVLAAFLWAGLAVIQVSALLTRPSLLQVGLAAFALTYPLLFIIRRPARAHGPRYAFWLAVFGTFVPVAALRPGGVGWPLPGEVIQIIGLGIILVAVWTLNRSFGLAPAHRGLVMRGMYRLVRHPLYAGELLALAGYCIGFASLLNWVAWAVAVVVQVARIFAEEKLLSGDTEYQAYQQRVRWRLVPGVW